VSFNWGIFISESHLATEYDHWLCKTKFPSSGAVIFASSKTLELITNISEDCTSFRLKIAYISAFLKAPQ
jgi:hypothetical protein